MILPICNFKSYCPKKSTNVQTFSADKQTPPNNNHKTLKVGGGITVGTLLIWGLLDFLGDKASDKIANKKIENIDIDLSKEIAEIRDFTMIPIEEIDVVKEVSKETVKKGLKTFK